MTLRRTAAGLASLHLFFRVDVVVYCEGGNMLSESTIAEGAGDDDTLDALFWRRISEFLGATRTYHFKSIGNKATLTSIAHDVQHRNITTIVICLDRDYDWHCACQIKLKHVAYTYGYSWESDVASCAAFERLFFRLLPRTPPTKKSFEAGKANLAKLGRELAPWCQGEIALCQKQKGVLFPRQNPVSMVDLNTELPTSSKERLKKQLQSLGYKRKPRTTITIRHTESLRHVWGKLVSKYLYHLAMSLFRKHDDGIRLTYDVFMRFLMADMIEIMRHGALPDVESHYRTLGAIFR
jgi:hypothetical protein